MARANTPLPRTMLHRKPGSQQVAPIAPTAPIASMVLIGSTFAVRRCACAQLNCSFRTQSPPRPLPSIAGVDRPLYWID